MVVGLMLAIPALRTRGVNLAVITLAFAWAAQDMIFTNPSVGGADVGINVGNASLFGLDVSGADQPARYAALTFLVFVICGVLVANLRRGRLGRRMIAVRSNERAAAASGIGVFRTKMIAFAVSGALAGLAGILISFQYQSAVFSAFDPATSLLALAWIVIGGVGYRVRHDQRRNRGARGTAVAHRTALAGLCHLASDNRGSRCAAGRSLQPNGIASQQVRDMGKLAGKLGAKLGLRSRAHAWTELEMTAADAPIRSRPPAAAGRRPDRALRRRAGRRRSQHRRRTGRSCRPHRPKRRRKDIAHGCCIRFHPLSGPRAPRRPAS